MRVGEEAFVERDIEVDGVIGGHPVDRRLDLAAVGGLPAGGLGVIGAQQAGDLTVGAGLDLGARDEVTGSKADLSPRRRRKNFFGGSSMKSSRSMNSRPEKGTSRVPAAASSGLLIASRTSARLVPSSSTGQLVITTSIGSSTTMRGGRSRCGACAQTTRAVRSRGCR